MNINLKFLYFNLLNLIITFLPLILMIVVIKEEYSLEETYLEESCVEEYVEVMPHDLELVDPIYVERPPKSISISIILAASLLFHSSMDPSMSTSLESETCMIYAPNLDWIHELGVTIGLEDCIEDLGFMPSLFIHASCKTSRPLSSTLSDIGHVRNSYNF